MFNQDQSRLEEVKQNKSYSSIRKMNLGVKYKQGDTEVRLAIKGSFKLQNVNNNSNKKKITLTLL